jgi:predicted RNase H-like HicB family nuclease
MYDYSIRFEQEDGVPGLAVFCRDLPELNSFGDDREHSIREAVDAIETALSIYVDQRRIIPEATPPREGEHVVQLPAVTVAKILLWNTMMKRGFRKSVLYQTLGVAQTQGDRLVDFLHTSKMEQMEKALAAFGVHTSLTVVVDLDRAIYDHIWHEAKCGNAAPISVEEITQAVSDRFKINFTPEQVAHTAQLTGFWQIDAARKRHNIPPYKFVFARIDGGQVLTHVQLIDRAVQYPGEWGFKPYS